jgi:gas vesicle protein
MVSNGGRVNENSRVMTGAVMGALIGAAAAYLFFTERGRGLRDRLDPMVADLRREFGKFQQTAQHIGDMANQGMRVYQEFNSARTSGQFGANRTSH